MIFNLLLASAEKIDPQHVEHAYKAVEHAVEHMNFIDYILHSNVINFLIVVAFVCWLIKKFNVLDAITQKQNLTIEKIKYSENAKKEAETEYKETEKKLENIDSEVKVILDNGKEISQSLSEQIDKETQNEVKNLEERQEKTIKMEKQIAAQEVTKEISKAATYIAEEHIKQAVNDDMHQKFINEFIDNLENVEVK